MRYLIVALLAVAIYAPSVSHHFVLDDGVQIFRNPAVTDGAPLAAYFLDRGTTTTRDDYNTRIYRPLRNLAFRAIVVVAGVHPLAFGVAGVVLYVVAALLLLRLLSALVDARAATWATALWVALSVHVEAVVYASALGDLLSLVCLVGAFLVALPLLPGGGARWRWLASPSLAAAAMLAKEAAVVSPALMALLVIAAGRSWRDPRGLRLVALHAAVAVAYLALRTHVLGAVGQDPVTAASIAAGLYDAPWLLVNYALITVEPLGHSASYRAATPSWPALIGVLIGFGAVAFAVRRHRRVAVGLAWFAVALLPVLHLVPLWADLADRFALLPSVGLALAVAAGPAVPRRLVAVVLGAAIVVYAGASVLEARAWRSDAFLWRYAVDRQPSAPLARANLAVVFLREGRLADAAAQLDALRAADTTRGDIELRRAYVLFRLARPDVSDAIAAALRLSPTGPARALAGQIAHAAGDDAAAQTHFAAARALSPSNPSVGLLGYQLQGVTDARAHYLAALQALSFDDGAGAAGASEACLRLSPAQPQCESSLAQAQLLAGPITPEIRALLSHAMPLIPPPDRRRCQEALWSAE